MSDYVVAQIMYDSLQPGTAVVARLADFFHQEKVPNAPLIPVMLDVRRDDKPAPECQLLIIWNVLEHYLKNRFNYTGRPYTIACSWGYADLFNLQASSLTQKEAGIDHLVTNCQIYVQNGSPAAPATFSFKPVGMVKPDWNERFSKAFKESGPFLAGTVVLDVEDRDFSQLEYTATHIGNPDKFFVFVARGLLDQLPAGRYKTKMVPIEHCEEEMAYSVLNYYIPVPRLTDYRYKIMPPELLQAMVFKAFPMLIYHPALEPILNSLSPIFISLKSYEDACRRMAMSNLEMQAGILKPFDCDFKELKQGELLLGPQDFGKLLKEVYVKGIADAPKGA